MHRHSCALGVVAEVISLTTEVVRKVRADQESKNSLEKLEEEVRKKVLEAIRMEAEGEKKIAEEEARKLQEVAKLLEAEREKVEEERQKARKFEELLANGTPLDFHPGPDDYKRMKAKLGVSSDSDIPLIFVAGSAGAGKSTFIGSLLKHKYDTIEEEQFLPDVPPAGEGSLEQTSESKIYEVALGDRIFNFCDIPGYGGVNASTWDYYRTQGIWCADAVVLIYDARLTESDIDMLKRSKDSEIPTILVRSKMDTRFVNAPKTEAAKRAKAEAALRERLSENGLQYDGGVRLFSISAACLCDVVIQKGGETQGLIRDEKALIDTLKEIKAKRMEGH